jgi:hypothetical protein
MRIDKWPEEFQEHFATQHNEPPTFVYGAGRALVGDAPIASSWATYKPGKPTVWSFWLVLASGALAHIEVEFDAENYVQTDERNNVEATLQQCWIRNLRDVVGYEFTGLGPATTTPWRWCFVHGVRLTFRDGQLIELPGNSGLALDRANAPTLERSDEFIKAVRAACVHLTE